MKKIAIISFICIVIITLTIILFTRKNTIYVESFDRSEIFVLVEYNTRTKTIYIDEHFNQYSFTVSNSEEFISDVVLTHVSYVGTFVEYNPNIDIYSNIYLFVENGYPYVLSQVRTGEFTLRSADMYIDIDDEQISLQVPFIDSYQSFDEDDYFQIDWNEVWISDFSSFEDYVDFYELLDSSFIQIDEIEKTISMKANIYEDNILTDGFYIKFIFNDNGFTIQYSTD